MWQYYNCKHLKMCMKMNVIGVFTIEVAHEGDANRINVVFLCMSSYNPPSSAFIHRPISRYQKTKEKKTELMYIILCLLSLKWTIAFLFKSKSKMYLKKYIYKKSQIQSWVHHSHEGLRAPFVLWILFHMRNKKCLLNCNLFYNYYILA